MLTKAEVFRTLWREIYWLYEQNLTSHNDNGAIKLENKLLIKAMGEFQVWKKLYPVP